jgi:precorrin-6B methylase 2
MSLSAILRTVRHASERRFDRKHGLDTCGMVETPKFAGMPVEVGRDANPYFASGKARIRRMIRRSRINPSDYHFVDFGTGKGRPLIVASAYPFKSITGIEADHELCEIARANVTTWFRSHCGPPIKVIEADARTTPLPNGNLFIFMYNPFSGDVLEEVSEHLAELARGDRKLVVAYSGDELAGALEGTGAFRRVPIPPLRPWLGSSMSLFFNPAAEPKRR